MTLKKRISSAIKAYLCNRGVLGRASKLQQQWPNGKLDHFVDARSGSLDGFS